MFDEIEDKGSFGFYRTVLAVEGLKNGGVVTIQTGWYNQETREWIHPETHESTQPVARRHLVSLQTPIIHFGTLYPTFSMNVVSLLLDSVRK